MKKFLDRLLGVFMRIYGFVLYSLVLKFTLGIIWILGGLYIWFGSLPWSIQVLASIITGIYLKSWLDKHYRDKQK